MTEIRTSPEIDALATALAGAQIELENVAKSGKNPHFRSSYATLPDTLDEIRPKLSAAGIAIFQATVNSEDMSAVGVITRLIHKSGQWMESALYLPPAKFDAQSVGSLVTYLRRYTLLAAAGISAGDDDGEAAVGRPSAASAPPPAPRQRARQAWAPPQEPIPIQRPQANEATVNPVVQRGNGAVPEVGDPRLIRAKDQLDFGTQYIAAIKTSRSPEELTEWQYINRDWLEDIETNFPKIQRSISAATTMVSQRLPVPEMIGEDDVEDVLR